MLTKRILHNVARMSANTTVNFQTQMPRYRPVHFQNYRNFSKDESSFDAHDDFAAKSKVQGGGLEEQISGWVDENDVCLFMKGTRKMPRCGFSNYVVQIFKFYGVKQFKDVNVLDDEKLREQIKAYSNWPTIPQVYIKGQFVGGCDIMKEMHADGSLEELLIREGIIKQDDIARTN